LELGFVGEWGAWACKVAFEVASSLSGAVAVAVAAGGMVVALSILLFDNGWISILEF
jgi:hypothetical protein